MKNCIRAVRKRLKMTQGDLAAAAGVAKCLVSDIERGKAKDIKASTMKKIADALGVNPFDIFYWDDPKI